MLNSLEGVRFGLALVQVGRLPVWREPDHADAVRQVAEAGRGHWRLGGHHHRHCHLLQVSISPLHCNENPIYVFLEKELPVLSPNFYIQVSVSDLYSIFPIHILQIGSPGVILRTSVGTGRSINISFGSGSTDQSVILNSGSGSFLNIVVANENTICCK